MDNRFIAKLGWIVLPALLLLAALASSVASADEGDPPGRVARLSVTNGAVSMQPAGVQDWTAATVNRPLTTGDKLWTDQDSRAELDLGSAAIRLGPTTGFSFLNLDDQTTQMNLTAGTAIVHVRDLGDNQNFEIDTPNLAVALQSPGDYRVEVNDAGNTTVVKVSNGDAQAIATGQSVQLHTQQAFAFTGTDQVSANPTSPGAPDSLDEWSLDRDHQAEQAESSQYVSPDVAGAGDLDNYGTWSSVQDYGDVWTPTAVAPDWAPYHYGRWVWVSPWGWTWVDDAPWGFAPFHYGRWAYVDTRWCWVPGPRRIRPVYAPALVAWVGGAGAAVAISVGGGAGVGWLPLGPREVYVPGYHVSEGYVRRVNVSNTTIVNNTYITNVYQNKVTNITYANRRAPGGVTAVTRTVFTSAQPISGHAVRVSEGEFSRYGASGAAPAIAPVRQSLLGAAPNLNVRRPPAAFSNRPVVARLTPPPAPVPFDRQQDAIRANGGRPLPRAQLSALQASHVSNMRVRMVTPTAVPNGPHQAGGIRPGTPFNPGGARAQSGQQPNFRAEQGGQQPSFRPGQTGQQQNFGPGQQGGQSTLGSAPPGPRPNSNAGQPNQQQNSRGGGDQLNMQERERALHATPIPPQQQHVPSPPSPPQNAMRDDRQMRDDRPQDQEYHTDRPPQSQMRHNDMYRLPDNGSPRPTPQAHAIEPTRPAPEAHAFEPPRNNFQPPRNNESRPAEQSRFVPPPRQIEPIRPAPEAHAFEPPRPAPETHTFEPPRPAPEAHAFEPPRPAPEAHAIEQPRPAPQFHAPEPPRPGPEAHAVEPPHPPQQAHSPPPAHVDEPRGRPSGDRDRNRPQH
jgi:hypothetical protein